MTEPWNSWDIKPPPVCTVMTELHSKKINNLNEVTYNALKTVRDLTYLDKEAAILSRFLYKNKRVFRQDKGIQNLVKVNQCLKRYLKLNMSEVLFTFKHCLPFKPKPILTHAYLPTRQMLKWVLLRLQAFSQIFVRMIELTKAIGSYIYKKLCLGWSFNLTLLVFCISARILVTSKYVVTKSIEWYNSFYGYLPFLQETSDFLPNYELPPDLKVWIGQVDLTPLKKKTYIDNIFDFIDLVKEEDDKERDEENEIEVVKETFLKTFFKPEEGEVDLDIEEIKIEKIEKADEEVKFLSKKLKSVPSQTSSMCEDLGVPVEVDKEETLERSRKRMRQKKEGKKGNFAKKLKKSANL